jgi:hypothetical protein
MWSYDLSHFIKQFRGTFLLDWNTLVPDSNGHMLLCVIFSEECYKPKIFWGLHVKYIKEFFSFLMNWYPR